MPISNQTAYEEQEKYTWMNHPQTKKLIASLEELEKQYINIAVLNRLTNIKVSESALCSIETITLIKKQYIYGNGK